MEFFSRIFVGLLLGFAVVAVYRKYAFRGSNPGAFKVDLFVMVGIAFFMFFVTGEQGSAPPNTSPPSPPPPPLPPAASGPAAPLPSESRWTPPAAHYVLRLVSTDNQVRFTVVNPSAPLQRTGVREGSVLFEGQRIGNRLQGNAYDFQGKCGVTTRSFVANVSADQRTIDVSTQLAQSHDEKCVAVMKEMRVLLKRID